MRSSVRHGRHFLLSRAVDELQFISIIAVAHGTLISEPVILCAASCGAVIADDPSFGVRELTWHGLSFDMPIELAPLELHVDGTAVADWALVRCLHVRVVAFAVNIMTTAHRNNGGGRGKHVFAADWASALGRLLDTAVCQRPGD